MLTVTVNNIWGQVLNYQFSHFPHCCNFPADNPIADLQRNANLSLYGSMQLRTVYSTIS